MGAYDDISGTERNPLERNPLERDRARVRLRLWWRLFGRLVVRFGMIT